MKRQRLAMVMVICGIFLMGCATMNVNLTPKQASAWMNNIYAAQYDEYLTWFNQVGVDDNGKPVYELKANVPEKQIKILQTKKKIFVELEPLLKEYAAYAATGEKTPLIDQAAKRATALVQQLIEMEGGE